MDTGFLFVPNRLSAKPQTRPFGGARRGVTLTRGPGRSVRKLYGERLAGGDHVSFNLDTTAAGRIRNP